MLYSYPVYMDKVRSTVSCLAKQSKPHHQPLSSQHFTDLLNSCFFQTTEKLQASLDKKNRRKLTDYNNRDTNYFRAKQNVPLVIMSHSYTNHLTLSISNLKFMFLHTWSVTGCCSSVLHGMSGCGLLMLFLHAVDIELC